VRSVRLLPTSGMLRRGWIMRSIGMRVRAGEVLESGPIHVQAASQVISGGSVNQNTYWWYTAGAAPDSAAGPFITTINHMSFYGQ
jgi:hypothetical protein